MKKLVHFQCSFCEKKFTRLLSCFQYVSVINKPASLCGSCSDEWRRGFFLEQHSSNDNRKRHYSDDDIEEIVRKQAEEDKIRIGRGEDE